MIWRVVDMIDAQLRTPRFRALRIAITGVVAVAVAAITALFVWFLGYDWLWSAAGALTLCSVGVIVFSLKFDDQTAWEPHAREAPRGVRLALPMMEESLAACDRLARPPITRHIRVMLTNDRDDRLAQGTLLRQMRALLVAELRVRGIDPAKSPEESVTALLGRDALAVLQPNDDTPVTTVVIANCLDAVDRLTADSLPSQ